MLFWILAYMTVGLIIIAIGLARTDIMNQIEIGALARQIHPLMICLIFLVISLIALPLSIMGIVLKVMKKI